MPYSINLVPIMISNSLPYGYASSSSERSTTYSPWKAFDNGAGRWSSTSAGKLNCWLQYIFTTPQAVTKYIVTSTTTEAPKAWKFQAYNPATSAWVDLDTQIGVTDWTVQAKSYTFANTTKYTNYRIYITEQNGGTYTSVYQLEMYAEAAPYSQIAGIEIQAEYDTEAPVAGISEINIQVEYGTENPIAQIGGICAQVEYTDGIAPTSRLKKYVDGEWVAYPLKTYIDGEWVEKPLKFYNGVDWVV